MKNQILDLDELGLSSMSRFEINDINGGDVDGLMRGSTPDLSKVVNGVKYAINFVAGFFGIG
jgi:hypothetical protein